MLDLEKIAQEAFMLDVATTDGHVAFHDLLWESGLTKEQYVWVCVRIGELGEQKAS
jgi:hypothetical protein